MRNALIRLIGWKAAIFHGDPCVYDRWRWLGKHLLPGQLRTLDAGCGNGVFTMYASKIGNESVGISHDSQKNQMAEFRAGILGIKNIRFIQGDLRDLNEVSGQLGKFDQIICLETIEHVQNDKKLIMELSGLLKPSGRLLITAPYKYHKKLLYEKLTKDENGGHLRWGYTHPEIGEIFKECSLDIETEEYISGFVSQHLTNLIRLSDNMIGQLASWVLTLPLRALQIFDSPLTKFINYPYLCIGVIGRKTR